MHDLEQSVIRILNTQGLPSVLVLSLPTVSLWLVLTSSKLQAVPLIVLSTCNSTETQASNLLTSSRKDTRQSKLMMWPSCYLIHCQKASLQ